jgi:tetratricopeptide (TPR) repeat protein
MQGDIQASELQPPGRQVPVALWQIGQIDDVAGLQRELAVAGFGLSEQVDGRPIAAVRLAWFSLVDGRYRDQIEFARTGLAIAPDTSAGVQLAVQEAKAWARLGDRREAEDAMRRAANSLAKLPLPAHPDHHFVFDASKLSFYASTCYTWLGEVERAEEHGHQVVSQCLEVPSEVRWPMRLAETRVDLALIAVERGQLDEAVDLGVKALGSHRKSGHTLGRVAELDEVLMRRHAGVPVAADFHEGFAEANRVLREAAT